MVLGGEVSDSKEDPGFSRSIQVFIFIASIVLYLLLGVVLWWFLDLYIDPSEAEEPSGAKRDLFQALGLIMAGVAGVVGVYFTWRNLKQTQESTQATLRLAESGQTTERFTRAIEQLGATDEGKQQLEIRLGGVYALERIAKDYPEEYYSTVMEVLTAYVRQNAPVDPGDAIQAVLTEPNPLLWQRPPADIQAILSILGRPEEFRVPVQSRVRLDLGGTDLRKADLDGANFRGVELRSARLERTFLRKTNLEDAVLEGANLWRADLWQANLTGANFRAAHLEGANLESALLRRANVKGADLKGADLKRANLEEANLRAAYLAGLNLEGANLRNTNLRNTDLRQTRDVTQEQIDQAIGDETTQLPQGLTRPARWLDRKDRQTNENE
jgi:uncharacterized protein YjbI with pentapeptide repeats